VSDGTSNTILMSERCIHRRASGSSFNILHACVQNASAVFGTDNGESFVTSVFKPSAVSEYIGTNKMYKTTGLVFDANRTGQRWSCGLPVFSTFSTILAPNGPSVLLTGDTSRYLGGPTSYHTGGANASMVDGSVQFISSTIGTGNQDLPAVMSGISPYGVWGALGSASGGDSGSL